MEPLTATVEVSGAQADTDEFLILLRIKNQSDRPIMVLNSDMGIPAPAMQWSLSQETYQTSLLVSFGYLSISVTDEMGKAVLRQAIQSWATPVLRPKIQLEQGERFELAIPIGSFYQLASGRTYLVALEYGDQDLKVAASASVIAP